MNETSEKRKNNEIILLIKVLKTQVYLNRLSIITCLSIGHRALVINAKPYCNLLPLAANYTDLSTDISQISKINYKTLQYNFFTNNLNLTSDIWPLEL